jgi:hypothetical protein
MSASTVSFGLPFSHPTPGAPAATGVIGRRLLLGAGFHRTNARGGIGEAVKHTHHGKLRVLDRQIGQGERRCEGNRDWVALDALARCLKKARAGCTWKKASSEQSFSSTLWNWIWGTWRWPAPPRLGWPPCDGGGCGGGRSSRRAMKASWSGRVWCLNRSAARRTPAMLRPSITWRLAADHEDAMVDWTGLGLSTPRGQGGIRGLGRVLARCLGVLRRVDMCRGGWMAGAGRES